MMLPATNVSPIFIDDPKEVHTLVSGLETRLPPSVKPNAELNFWDTARAKVANVAGTWKALTDNVNVMAKNLTLQVRTIAVATVSVFSIFSSLLFFY